MKTLDEIDKIKKYLEGKMSNIELIEFEQLLSEDEFLKDAVEGYKKSKTSPEDLEFISQKFVSKSNSKRLLYIFVYSGIAAAILIVFMFIYYPLNKIPKSDTKMISKDTINRIDTYINDDFAINSSLEENPDTLKETKTYITEIIPVSKEPLNVSESIAPLFRSRPLIIENTTPKNDISEYYRFRSNHRYAYIGDFKVVDYGFVKREGKKNLFIESNKNRDDFELSNYETDEVEKLTYNSFLEQSLVKIKTKKYFEAIDNLNIILENYPDDENAMFYKGFCYYEVNRNKQSMRYFDVVLKSKINTFHEEAKWYKGLILKREKEYAVAQKILEEIVNDNGYYGVQAKKELDDLYKLYDNE